MKSKKLSQGLRLATVLMLAAATGAMAQTPNHMKFRGVINDFTPESTGGPWEVRGPWSLEMIGAPGDGTCKSTFSAALTMERSDLGVMDSGGGDLNNPADRMAHTHNVTLVSGCVATITGGIEITGLATVTANGTFPPPFGSQLPTLAIDITGGTGANSVTYSNVTLLFGPPADGHFGSNPLHGVVRIAR